jgi:hypothetical protein
MRPARVCAVEIGWVLTAGFQAAQRKLAGVWDFLYAGNLYDNGMVIRSLRSLSLYPDYAHP